MAGSPLAMRIAERYDPVTRTEAALIATLTGVASVALAVILGHASYALGWHDDMQETGEYVFGLASGAAIAFLCLRGTRP